MNQNTLNDEVILIQESQLRKWTLSVLKTIGYNLSHAEMIADQLIDANLRGVDSHGVARLPIYCDRVEKNLISVNTKPTFKRKKSIIMVDAHNVQGQIVSNITSQKLIELSSKKGVAMSVIKNSTHMGSAGYYARKIAERGKIAMVLTNAESCVVPFGGTTPILGTNPISFAAPTKHYVLDVDFATSIVSFGKIFLSKSKNKKIPPTWGFDERGKETDDPDRIIALRSMAEHKGYALGIMVEVLSGIISSAAFGLDIGNMYKNFKSFQNVGHFMLVIDIKNIMPLEVFLERMENLIQMIKTSKLENELNPIVIPGELQQSLQIERLKHGIPIQKEVFDELKVLGSKLGFELNS